MSAIAATKKLASDLEDTRQAIQTSETEAVTATEPLPTPSPTPTQTSIPTPTQVLAVGWLNTFM